MGVAARDKLSAALPPSRIVLPRRVDHPASSRGRESTGTYAAASRLPPPVAPRERERRPSSTSPREISLSTIRVPHDERWRAVVRERTDNFHARAPADSLERGDGATWGAIAYTLYTTLEAS